MSRPLDRRAWVDAVCAHPRATPLTKLVLVRLVHEGMRESGRVSVPRVKLAAALHVDKSRVSAALKQGVELGLLNRVQKGRRGVTATYQALRQTPAKGADSAPMSGPAKGAETLTPQGAESAPSSGPDRHVKGAGTATPTRARTQTAPADVAPRSPDSRQSVPAVNRKGADDQDEQGVKHDPSPAGGPHPDDAPFLRRAS